MGHQISNQRIGYTGYTGYIGYIGHIGHIGPTAWPQISNQRIEAEDIPSIIAVGEDVYLKVWPRRRRLSRRCDVGVTSV